MTKLELLAHGILALLVLFWLVDFAVRLWEGREEES